MDAHALSEFERRRSFHTQITPLFFKRVYHQKSLTNSAKNMSFQHRNKVYGPAANPSDFELLGWVSGRMRGMSLCYHKSIDANHQAFLVVLSGRVHLEPQRWMRDLA